MPKDIVFGNPGAGWIPSDDLQGGRKNGLLQMDNVTLDINGALSLQGGTTVIRTLDAAPLDIYPTTIHGQEVIYAGTNNGTIYRDGVQIATGGDIEGASFGSAFSNVLATSGTKRIKDDGTTTTNLGIIAPVSAPTVTLIAPEIINTVDFVNSGAGCYFADFSDLAALATPVVTNLTAAPWQLHVKNTGLGFFINFTAEDWTKVGTGVATDNDIFNLKITAAVGDLSQLNAIHIYLMTDTSNPITLPYFAFTGFQAPTNAWAKDITGLTIGSLDYTINVKRSDFNQLGAFDMSAIYGVYVLCVLTPITGDIGLTLNVKGSIIPDLTLTNPKFAFYGGSNALNGLGYQWGLQYVNQNFYYQAKSAVGPLSAPLDVLMQNVSVSYLTPVDAQVNEEWVYRTGGNLGGPLYRIKLISGPTASTFNDLTSDLAALDIDITFNINLISIDATSITDTIQDIIGPISGRWFYFTTGFMYPSDINCPDLVNPSISIRTCGSTNELFMWARKVSDGIVLVGTSVDIYVLSGTFANFPDGSIDIYYRPLVCQHPPVCKQATYNDGSIYYMASDGWRSISSGGTTNLMVSPNIDLLYRGKNRYGYEPIDISKYIPGTTLFPCLITQNRFWGVAGPRIDIWDFTRNYWRPCLYNLGSITAIAKSVTGFPYIGTLDSKIRRIDVIDSGLIDGTTKQHIKILTPVLDSGDAKRRNDLYTLVVRFNGSTNDPLSISIVNYQGTVTPIASIAATGLEQVQVVLDLNSLIPDPTYNWQFFLEGNFSSFILTDITISVDQRPMQLTSLRIYNTNFGAANKKRLRMWPIVIDTMGNDVNFKPFIDNIIGTSTDMVTNEKTTVPTFFNYDAFGTDYGALITGGPFEFWEMGQPEIVQGMPVPKQFDQIGPQELFRYGKISEFEVRLFSLGGSIGTQSTIPYTIYFDDLSALTGNITVENQRETTYRNITSKGTNGSVVRIELGPTDFDFLRYSIRVKCTERGYDATDNGRWVTI